MKQFKFMGTVKGLLIMIAILTLLFVGGCGQDTAKNTSGDDNSSQPAASQGPQKWGTFKIGVAADASKTLGYPSLLFDTAGLFYSSVCLEPLVGVDDSGEPVPVLATDWQVAPDQKSIKFSLRKGVKFHDGSDWNADVAKWNLEKLRTEGASQFLKSVESVDILDDYTIQINLSRWDSGIYGNLATYAGPMISKKSYEENGQDWAVSHPVGTGPFKFVSWEKDVKQVYERFDGYWQQGKPLLDRIEWVVIPDPMVQVASLKQGEVDALWNMSTKQAKTLKDEGSWDISTTVNRLIGLAGDSKNADSVYANQKVRQAVEYALDKKALAETIGDSYWVPVWQPARPGSWAENPDVKGFQYDPQKAKDMLIEAGYPNGFKTKIYVQSVPPQPDLAVAVQAQLKAVGIEAAVEQLDPPKYYDMASNGWKDGLFFMGATVSVPDELLLLSKAHGPGFKGYVSQGVPAEIQDLIVKALGASDFKTKQAQTRDIMKAETENTIVNWLAFQQGVTVSSPKVHDHGIFSTGGAFRWTPESAWKEQ